MRTNRPLAMSFLAVSIALAASCGGGPDHREQGLEDQERALELALSGDTTPATFEDTALSPVPEATPPEPESAREPAPDPPRRNPAPERPAEDPTPSVAEPPVAEGPVVEVTPPESEPEPVMRTVPVGTTMQLSLNETLSTRSNQPGDAFTATLTSHVTDVDGAVLIPAGAILRGRVTEVQKSGRVGETAVLSLAFEAVMFEDGSYPLEASVVSANPERASRSSTGEQVGKVAVGAAAGAILGQVLGRDTKSTVKGAVIGAAAGTAIAMGTADVDAVLKAGSLMVVRTDAPVTVAGPRTE